ncbi:MAG TPA: sugar phosphate isomerase/epimerase [Abditibacterium sp.]|jgi:sugar phosphate isomerase/epimerase
MLPFANLSDHSSLAPRMRVGHTLWNLEKLPMNSPVEWTIAEKMRRVKDAGFEHIECWIGDNEHGAEVVSQVRENGLHFALGHRPLSVEDTRKTIEFAAKCDAQWVLCQPASAYHSLEEVVQIVREGAKIAADSGMCYFVETHRNNYTETIRQTLELIEAVPEIAITADFSHFVVGGEFYGWESEGAIERMRPIIERVAHVHGRISNGEQVQVDVGDGSGGEGTPAGFFKQIWTEIFKTWRAKAKNGDIIAFSSELGPPRYAITLPDGSEFSDRWEQSLVMKKLALEAWELSN